MQYAEVVKNSRVPDLCVLLQLDLPLGNSIKNNHELFIYFAASCQSETTVICKMHHKNTEDHDHDVILFCHTNDPNIFEFYLMNAINVLYEMDPAIWESA